MRKSGCDPRKEKDLRKRPVLLQRKPQSLQTTVVVDPNAAGTGGVYRTVGDALRLAPKATTIELRFNGLVSETAWRLSGRNVRIVAAADCRPVLSFAPEASPVESEKSVIQLDSGRLSLIDTAIELVIPLSDTVERWTLVELLNRPEMIVRGGVLTVRNAADRGIPYHEDVAFFRAEDSRNIAKTSGEVVASEDDRELAVVELSDTVVRGEASLLGVHRAVSITLLWNNGLLAVNRPAIFTRGVRANPTGARVDIEWAPRHGDTGCRSLASDRHREPIGFGSFECNNHGLRACNDDHQSVGGTDGR